VNRELKYERRIVHFASHLSLIALSFCINLPEKNEEHASNDRRNVVLKSLNGKCPKSAGSVLMNLKRFISRLADHHETNEEIELKILNETKNSTRVKRSIQNYHRLTPHEQQLQRHHQRQLQHQYEAHQRELRERELRERQRISQTSQYRTTPSTSNYSHNQRDARRYQQMQQPPPQQQYNHQHYHYRHDYQNALHNSQHQKSDETKEYTIEVLVAVDKKMQEYHGKNLKNYVLTLMSVVSVQLFFCCISV
jgi:hypothetical protein